MSQPQRKSPRTDWRTVDQRMGAGAEPSAENPAQLPAHRESRLTHTLAPLHVGAPHLDEGGEPRGLLNKMREKRIRNGTTVEALKAKRNADLDVLGHKLKQAVTTEKARIDWIAKEFLMRLDAELLEALKDQGVRNAETRAAALIQLRDMIARQLRIVQEKDWPEAMVNATIDDLLVLEKRVGARMMKELGD